MNTLANCSIFINGFWLQRIGFVKINESDSYEAIFPVYGKQTIKKSQINLVINSLKNGKWQRI